MDSNVTYSTGDWVVHSYYGVGQIKGVEVKPILGEDKKCFKVKTNNSTFWFPKAEADNPRIRPIASQDIIEKVIRNLRRKSNKLNTDRKYWKKQIDEVQANGDLLSISILIRDLSAQQVIRRLNQTEENALAHLEDRLIREWAAITQKEIENIRPKLNACIEVSKTKVEINSEIKK